MPAPTITALPPAPLRSQNPATFSPIAETFVDALEDLPGEINAFGTYLDGLGLDPVDVPAEASAAEIRTGTATDKFISPDKLYDSAAPVALTDSANIAVDLNDGLNFEVTLAGDRTLDNPTNAKPGQSGLIIVTQDATGSRTLSFGNKYLFAGGAATLSTSADAEDVIAYYVRANGDLLCTLSTGFAAT